MKKTASVWLLLLQLLILGALLFLRTRPAAKAPEPAASPTPTAAAVLSAPPEASPSPAPTPEPTPEPAPEATPLPTPQPLREPEITESTVDAVLFAECDQPGTLLRVEYTTPDYVFGMTDEFPKPLEVYLPYGYDEAEHYDLLFLFHVRQADERFWLDREHEYVFPDGTRSVTGKQLLDNMIALGYCRPMIVVCPWSYLDSYASDRHLSQQNYPQMSREFGEVILPYVVEHFATWAEGGSREQLRAAREHIAVLGASFGAYMTELSVLAPNLDLVSWYAMAGGGDVTRDYLEPYWNQYGTNGLPIDLLYFVEGEYDDIGPIADSYQGLSNWSEVFAPEENLRFTILRQNGHTNQAWLTTLYNAAQLFFREA